MEFSASDAFFSLYPTELAEWQYDFLTNEEYFGASMYIDLNIQNEGLLEDVHFDAPNIASALPSISGSDGEPQSSPSVKTMSSFSCNWAGCANTQTYSRRSEWKKHMDRHTRPYTCTKPVCNGLDFGDKAGLQRHEREIHGSVKMFCPFASCRRHTRGFARKRNLEAHVKTRHKASDEDDIAKQSNPETRLPSLAGDGNNAMTGSPSDEEGGSKQFDSEMNSLQLKLQEREAEKVKLALCKARVDEDIAALKRALHLVSG